MGLCKDCDFWFTNYEVKAEIGCCRNKSPVPNVIDSTAVWPITLPNDWCAEFRESHKARCERLDKQDKYERHIGYDRYDEY